MAKKLLPLVISIGVILGLSACSGSSDTKKGTNTASEGTAQEIFSQNCASCHGGNLGGGVGPNLQKVGSKYSKAEILNIIKNGKGGGRMPGGLISGDEANKVAEWLAAKK